MGETHFINTSNPFEDGTHRRTMSFPPLTNLPEHKTVFFFFDEPAGNIFPFWLIAIRSLMKFKASLYECEHKSNTSP